MTKIKGKEKMLHYDENNVWHVYPNGDVQAHDLMGIGCECNPKIEIQTDKALLVIHKAYDGREGIIN